MVEPGSVQEGSSVAQQTSLFQRLSDYEGHVNLRVPINARRLRITAMLLGALTVVGSIAYVGGWLDDWYRSLYMNTAGRPYTEIMRERPWLFPAGATIAIVPASFLLPRQYWVRLVLLFLTFWVGFLGGHVFWA